MAKDFNGDGRTDLAVKNEYEVSVLLGNGDGTFQTRLLTLDKLGGFALVTTLVAGDFNGDGIPDLAGSNGFDTNAQVLVLLGNGDGTFQHPVPYTGSKLSFPGSPASVKADFNGDGIPDLAVANTNSNDVSVQLNLADNEEMVAPGSIATNPHATPLVADLSGDGADDVMVINGAGDILWRKGRRQEPGTFDPPIKINPGYPSRDIVAVDTNQGRVLASVDAKDNAISLYAWRDGKFARLLLGPLTTGLLPAQIVTADLNGDGWDDLVVRNADGGTLTVFFSSGSEGDATGNALFPRSVALPVGLGVSDVTLGVSDVTLADVDRDGATDIVVTYKVSGEVGVLRNLGHGTFAPVVLYRAGGGLYGVTNNIDGSATLTTLEATSGVAAGAFIRGGLPDLVTINPGSNWFDVLAGLGAGRFTNPVAFPTQTPARVVRVADFNRDGVSDLALLGTGGVSVWLGDGRGGFFPDPSPSTPAPIPPA